jgi:hypothetical protein
MDGYIAKPIRTGDMFNAIDQVLGKTGASMPGDIGSAQRQ